MADDRIRELEIMIRLINIEIILAEFWHVRLYIRSRTGSHGLSRSGTIAYTIIHGHRTRASFFKSFKNHTRLTRIHSNGPSVSWIRPRFIRLYVRFTRVANRVNRVFCVRRALGTLRLSTIYHDY